MDFDTARERLIAELHREFSDEKVLAAMSRIPREKFVPLEQVNFAYHDKPLPIGFQQTISQPLIVAMMTRALELTGTETVLEVGTGSGYQAAVLAELAAKVVTVERIPQLAVSAEKVLNTLGYDNITIHLAGDDLGWPQDAPYDAIIVTAGAPEIPRSLVSQLKTGGILVIPAGSRHIQELLKVTRLKTGTKVEKLGGCRFVSLIGKEAWGE
ncbi:MAG: protein-L-isoaspartate(D-aspartate) O-methyltransferase [Dehalococcoidales bacterium]|nr:protein-L-isoaspartate(D-aspartate) O-methyltransferase [Dehalococcoidales bacterium]